ncbi:PREDICTED: 28S ribosomal protein S5, mitochondrial [Ceratosolen solmsi marchali]|uniref:Small ribosomal subunit protein uS5m n=1 Tax=Ceratosolen solmsi marchali TaxID=326594 RepID=A0AAJ7E2C8_9HYME|nr:PREDICTED: 28S ribosomal protein S5, mitochondrial [Ceratosolen solmsi marchali]
MSICALRCYTPFIKPIQRLFLIENRILNKTNIQNIDIWKLQTSISVVRPVSVLAKYTGKDLWKSVLSVSNAGKNRGRGKGLKRRQKDLNKGQIIGIGKLNMVWPGLNAPVMQEVNIVKPHKVSTNLDRELQSTTSTDLLKRRSRKVHPLLRGWTSAKLGGKSIGPPESSNENSLNDFETKVIQHRVVSHMTGNLGRVRVHSIFAITGNQKGLCGFSLGKASEISTALRLAKNRAGLKLMLIPIYNNHTVYHDFFSQFGSTKLFVSKKYDGYGLVCHRAIKCACEVIGIKDIYVKVEGAINYQHIIKAFILGLLRQKTHQQLAEEKQLHLVEFRNENQMYPKVIATPATVRKPAEVSSMEILDFTQYVLGGKVVLKKKKYPPFYINYNSYKIKQRKMEYLRNQDQVRIEMYAKHGELKSFLTDKYPEAKPHLWKKNRTSENEEEN